jgi:hypothetical protein
MAKDQTFLLMVLHIISICSRGLGLCLLSAIVLARHTDGEETRPLASGPHGTVLITILQNRADEVEPIKKELTKLAI